MEYELKEHAPVYTSEEAAQIRGAKMEQGAKALIFRADGQPVLIVVPGNKRVDTKKFKQVYGIKDLKFLSPEEVFELTGLEVGAIPPLGNAMGLPTYADESLLRNETIEFNAGAHTKSIHLRSDDYLKICPAILGNFT